MNIRNCFLALGAAVVIAACGGGEETPVVDIKARTPHPVVNAATVTGGRAVAIHLYQALYGMAPSSAMFLDYTAQATADPSAFARNLASNFASTSSTALAKLVLNNLGVTATTVTAVNGQGQSEYAILLDALGQMFAFYGLDARGQIILNATNLLAGLESDPTYGVTAVSHNNQVTSNLAYSSNTANTVAAAVPTAIRPTVTFSAEALINGTTNLTWNSTNATNCSMNGHVKGFSGYFTPNSLTSPSGTANVMAEINDSQTFSITCNGPGGSATATTSATPPQSFPANCAMSTGDFRNYFHIGSFMVGNSTWSSAVASSPNPTHCISGSISSDGTIKTISNWSFDNTEGIKTNEGWLYGQMKCCGQPMRNSTHNMPILISNITSTFGVNYTEKVENVSIGSAFDLLIDLYFSDTTDGAKQTLELSINQICVSSCYATYIDDVIVNGVTYRVNYDPATATAAPHLAFNSLSVAQYSGTVAFLPFIQYAILHGYLSTSGYMNSFSVSNEVFAGSASSTIVSKINP